MKNLVIIAAGKESQHQKWTEDHREHGFDLCLLSYDADHSFIDQNSVNARYSLSGEGMKFRLMSNFYKIHPEVLDCYHRVMVMDDDIVTVPSQAANFFRACAAGDFDLAQPGLQEGSAFTYNSTKRVRGAKWHLTNTVEIMMPCFSRKLLTEALEDIHHTPKGYGWGLEGAWRKRFHAGGGRSKFGGRIGVIDCVDFGHFRPVGEDRRKSYPRFGNPLDELQYYKQRYGFTWSKSSIATISVEWGRT